MSHEPRSTFMNSLSNPIDTFSVTQDVLHPAVKRVRQSLDESGGQLVGLVPELVTSSAIDSDN